MGEVGRFGGVVVEAAGGSGLLVGAPYAGLGLANFGKVYFFNSSIELPSGDISSQCEGTSAPCPGRWASAELTLHEEGSMFSSNIASSKSSRAEASTNTKTNPTEPRQVQTSKQIQQSRGKLRTKLKANPKSNPNLKKIQSKSS